MNTSHDDIGAYVLGALSEPEAAEYAAHLDGCASCRIELAELQVAVDTLPLVATQMAPPAALKDRIMSVVQAEAELLQAAGAGADRVAAPAERRRWWAPLMVRPALVGGLAALLLALGVAGGLLAGGGDPDARSIQAKVEGSGSATLLVQGSKATLRVEGLPSPPPGKVYQVWYQRSDKGPEPTHTLFSVRKSDGRAEVPIREPLDGVKTILVTAEDDGGSTYPTSYPVIRAQAA